MYKVIKTFADLQDNNHVYAVGDEFPREGTVADAGRILELSSNINRIGEPLIEEIIEVDVVEVVKEKPKKSKKAKE